MSDLREFSKNVKLVFDARDWDRFHAPKNIAMSLVSEAAELMQHFRWLTEESSRQLSSETLQEVSDELGDVLINVVALAEALDIDPLEAARVKLTKLEKRYPVEAAQALSHQAQRVRVPEPVVSTPESKKAIAPAREEEGYALALPVIVELGSGLSRLLLQDDESRTLIEQQIPKLRSDLYQDLGVRFPAAHIGSSAVKLNEWECRILLNEVPVVKAEILRGHRLVGETEETLAQHGIPYVILPTGAGVASIWVEDQHSDRLSRAGLKSWGPLEILPFYLAQFYRRYAAEFVGIQEVHAMLAFVEKSLPDLVKEIRRLIPLQKLTEIFKRLVEEEISIKDLRTILEALADKAQIEKDVLILLEHARESMARYISYKYCQGEPTLEVYIMDPGIEELIAKSITRTNTGSRLGLGPDTLELIKHAFRSAVQPNRSTRHPLMVLTSSTVRRFVKRLVETEFPEAAVISYQEVLPEIRIQPLGRIQSPMLEALSDSR